MGGDKRSDRIDKTLDKIDRATEAAADEQVSARQTWAANNRALSGEALADQEERPRRKNFMDGELTICMVEDTLAVAGIVAVRSSMDVIQG